MIVLIREETVFFGKILLPSVPWFGTETLFVGVCIKPALFFIFCASCFLCFLSNSLSAAFDHFYYALNMTVSLRFRQLVAVETSGERAVMKNKLNAGFSLTVLL